MEYRASSPGVLDITTTEWADETGRRFPRRRSDAARSGSTGRRARDCHARLPRHGELPQPDTLPAKFKGRTFYQHNPQVTLMRTNAEENAQLGKIIAEKVNLSHRARDRALAEESHQRHQRRGSEVLRSCCRHSALPAPSRRTCCRKDIEGDRDGQCGEQSGLRGSVCEGAVEKHSDPTIVELDRVRSGG